MSISSLCYQTLFFPIVAGISLEHGLWNCTLFCVLSGNNTEFVKISDVLSQSCNGVSVPPIGSTGGFALHGGSASQGVLLLSGGTALVSRGSPLGMSWGPGRLVWDRGKWPVQHRQVPRVGRERMDWPGVQLEVQLWGQVLGPQVSFISWFQYLSILKAQLNISAATALGSCCLLGGTCCAH